MISSTNKLTFGGDSSQEEAHYWCEILSTGSVRGAAKNSPKPPRHLKKKRNKKKKNREKRNNNRIWNLIMFDNMIEGVSAMPPSWIGSSLPINLRYPTAMPITNCDPTLNTYGPYSYGHRVGGRLRNKCAEIFCSSCSSTVRIQIIRPCDKTLALPLLVRFFFLFLPGLFFAPYPEVEILDYLAHGS